MRERSTWRLLGAAATSFLSSRVLAFLAGLAVAIPILLGGSEALASRLPAAAIEPGRPSPSPSAGASQLTPWGLPGPPPGTTTPTLFANFNNTPQSKFLEGGAFDQSGNFWFVASTRAGSPISPPTAACTRWSTATRPPRLARTANRRALAGTTASFT